MKNINYIIIGLLFMVFISFQVVEPAAAAKPKLIDHGTELGDGYSFTYKTYQYNKYYIVTKMRYYEDGVLKQKLTRTVKKISTHRIKITFSSQKKSVTSKVTEYFYSKLTRKVTSSLSAKTYYFTKMKTDPEFFMAH